MGDLVAYQGEPGAYSEAASHRLFPGAELEPLRTLHQVFDRVASGAVRAGVVPLENSQAGSINETYDLLARGDVHIVGEAVVRVDHALLALPGIPLEYVKRVSSHPAALAHRPANSLVGALRAFGKAALPRSKRPSLRARTLTAVTTMETRC